MTVEDLIAELRCMDPHLEVRFAYCYGDYWNTEVADEVERVEEQTVGWSEYHRTYKVLENGPDEDDEKVKQVVLLK